MMHWCNIVRHSNVGVEKQHFTDENYEDKNASNGCIMIIFLVLINSILNTKMALFDGTFIHEWFKMSNVFQINIEQYNVMFDHSLLGIKTCWLNHLSLFQVH